MARTQWGRFTRPFADIPPYSATTFTVTPGDVQVVYGSELGIRAVTRGAAVEQAELVLEDGQGQQTSLPMFPERDGSWQAVLSKVTEPAVYYVRSYRARSNRYQLGVITVPRIENVRLRIAPPEYANQATYEGPLPKDGVAGLPGTTVTIWATSNRPLGGGTLTVTGAKGIRPLRVKMQPSGEESQEVTGQFTVRGDGRFECRVIDQAGQPSQQTFAGSVTMLADQYPFIRILQPPPMSLATPTALIPVELSAEDDCGITRVELFRSLNDSRPLPADAAAGASAAAPLRRRSRCPWPATDWSPATFSSFSAASRTTIRPAPRGLKAPWSRSASFPRKSSSGWSAPVRGWKCC